MAEINFSLNTKNERLLADTKQKLVVILDGIEEIAEDGDGTYANLYSNANRRVGTPVYDLAEDAYPHY